MWLIIIASIVIIISLIVLSPVKVSFQYDKNLKVFIKYLCFSLYRFCSGDSTNRFENTDNQTAFSFKGNIEKISNSSKTFEGILNILDMLKEIFKYFKSLLPHIFIKNFKLTLKVSGEDAADTALKYGVLCSAVYPITNLINNCVNFKPENISVFADFKREITELTFKGEISVRLAYLISFAVSSAFIIIKKRMGVNSK